VGGACHVRRVADVITDQLGYPAHTFHPSGYEAARSGGAHASQPSVIASRSAPADAFRK
jgi:hypothetical protein